MLCSQLTYVSTVLTPTDKQLESIQTTINNFVQDIPITKKNWINSNQMYTPPKQGGMGMIKLEDFIQAIKVSWIRRYCIQLIDDHWADLIEQKLGLTIETRAEILEYGQERFNKIIKAKIPIISNLFQSYKLFKHHFPNTIESEDNTWLHQPVLYNLTSQENNQEKSNKLT